MDAFEKVFREHEDAVFRFAYLLMGEAAEADDVAQGTFIRAYKNFHRYDTSRPVRPWLLSIAANIARNRRRSIARYLNAVQRFLLPEPAPDYLSEPDQQSMWGAIRRLKPADQEVIYLRYFLQLSVQETADTLQIEVGTVKSRLSRAIERLRQVVEREFPDLKEVVI